MVLLPRRAGAAPVGEQDALAPAPRDKMVMQQDSDAYFAGWVASFDN